MPRTRVSLSSKAHQLGWLKTKKLQEADLTFVKFIVYPFTMIAFYPTLFKDIVQNGIFKPPFCFLKCCYTCSRNACVLQHLLVFF